MLESNELFSKLNITINSAAVEVDNDAYGGELLETSRGAMRLRTGKVTPTKPGFFVTVWRRAEGGKTEPFPSDSGVNFLVITVQDQQGSGMFIFPTTALVIHGIVSVNGNGGKRGFRLYPPWLLNLNPTAARSQKWQTKFFVDETAGLDRFDQLLTHLDT